MQMATSIEADNGEMIVKRVSVPIGLEELMEGLTKEVILKKPKDICVFASEYFARLLNLREQGSMKGHPVKRIQSITKHISPNNVAKQFKFKSKSVDSKILSRQTSIQPDSPTKRTLTTKKIVLNSKEEKEKAAEKTKNFLDKRKARRDSKDENNKIQRQASLGHNDNKTRRMSRTSSTSTEDSIKSSRKSSNSEIKKKKSNKSSPRQPVEVVNDLGKIVTVTETVQKNIKKNNTEDTEHSDTLSNKESSIEKEVSDVNLSDISVSEDNKNQKLEDVAVGDEALDTKAESLEESKLDVEEIPTEKLDEEAEKTQIKSEEVDNSVNEVDLPKNEEEIKSDMGKNNIEDEFNDSAEKDLKIDNEDTKKISNESTDLKSPAVETSSEVASSDALEDQVENQSTEMTDSKENVKNQVDIDNSVANSDEINQTSESCDDVLKPEEKPTALDDQKSESVADQDESNAELNKDKEVDVPDEEKVQENKENIDANKVETNDENVDKTKLSKTLMSSATSILGNVDSGKNKEAAKLKSNRTKSSTDEHLKTKDNKTKVKRIKSVDSSMKLKKTKSKSRLTSANEENPDEDTNNAIKKRSKRSASLDIKDNKTVAEMQESSFNSSNLHDEIKQVSDLSKATAFKTSYNPYKLRQEIKQASEDSKINETSMTKIAGEVAAAIRIQSIWRGFRSRKQTKDNHRPEIPTDQRKVEEVGTALTDSENPDNQDSISDGQTKNDDKIIIAEEKETKIMVEDEISGKNASSEETPNKKEENDETLEEKSSAEDQATNDQSKSIDGVDHDKILQESNLKITTPTMEEEGHSENKKIDDENSQQREMTNDEKSNTSSDVTSEVLPKDDSKESKQDHSLENDTEKEKKDTTADISEKKIEEEITKKLTSGLNLENSTTKEPPEQATDLEKKSKHQLEMALAVVRIQALWRGFKMRKLLKHEKVFGATVDKQVKNKEALEIMTRVRAVAKIQALWRGYKVRKNIKKVNKRLAELQKPSECDELMSSQRELSDEDIFKAAAKIQAGVRGYMVRKKGEVCHLNSISEETTPDLRVPEDVNEIHPGQEITSNDKDKTTGNEEVKNNAEPNTEEDNKKTENEVKFIATELNSSPTNKLSNLDTPAIIDDSISNSNVNKDGVDPNSSAIHNEPGYEDAPTRPVTSDTEPTNNKITKENDQTLTEEHKNNQINQLVKTDKVQEEKQNAFTSQESTTSVDSVATVIFNDTETQDEGKLPTDKQEIIKEQTVQKEKLNMSEIDNDETNKKSEKIEPHEEQVEKFENQNLTTDDLNVENLTEINNNSDVNVEDALSTDLQNQTTPNVGKELSKENEETNNQEVSDVKLKEANQITEERTSSDDPSLVAEDNNKINITALENEIKDSSKSDTSDEKSTSEDSSSKEKTSSENTLNDGIISQLSLENINNKLNVSALEHEIGNSNQQLQDLIARNSEENLDYSDKGSSLDNSVAEDIKTESSLTYPSENLSDENNTKEEEKEVAPSGKDILRIHIPLRELSEIKEEDGDAKSSTESVEELEDESKTTSQNQEASTKTEESPNEKLKESVEDESKTTSPNQGTPTKTEESGNEKLKESVGDLEDESKTTSQNQGTPTKTKESGNEKLESVEDESKTTSQNQGTPTKTEESVNEKLNESVGDESKTTSQNQEASTKTEESPNEKLKESVEDESKTTSQNQGTPIKTEENGNEKLKDNTTEAEIKDSLVDKKMEVVDKMASEEPRDESEVKNETSKPDHEDIVKVESAGARQKSPVGAISLVHSGEFHDTITVPISLTPPTTASSKEGEDRLPAAPGLVNTGELHDNVLPLSVQLNEAPPAGDEVVTSHLSESIIADGQDRAQASNKDASTCETQPDNTTSSAASMETEKRNNATTTPKKNMETEAATKIQAGFRGYQVRKQLKSKVSAPGEISNQRRSARRKSSGRISESGRITQKKSKSDIEEKSAVKIQAGVRGFLVRRRQKKQKQGGKESS